MATIDEVKTAIDNMNLTLQTVKGDIDDIKPIVAGLVPTGATNDGAKGKEKKKGQRRRSAAAPLVAVQLFAIAAVAVIAVAGGALWVIAALLTGGGGGQSGWGGGLAAIAVGGPDGEGAAEGPSDY